jgi:4,5-DOPA dioxygenase extradiol
MTIASWKNMPALFVGHGNPMNIIRHNQWTDRWNALGTALPRPKAVLCISAHWYIPAVMVTAMVHPRTIHDFGGFPRELYEIQYPAPGDPALACRVQQLLASMPAGRDETWGLDHGTWSVLSHIFPKADIPVVQLSIDRSQPPSFHYEIGKLLAPLRDEGVLILGSGNIVHNLQAYNWDRSDSDVFDWASRFEDTVRRALQSGQHASLINYQALDRDAHLSVPTPDHYLPLLYVLGSRKKDDRASFPVEGFDGGSMSMLAAAIG